MADLFLSKVVSTLPTPLEANALYLVKVGTGFRPYATNSTGTIVSYGLNPIDWSELTGKPTLLVASNNLSDVSAPSTARTNLGLGSSAVVSAKAWRSTPPKLSNNVADPTNDVDISAGVKWDNGNDVLLDLTGALTKRLDASWSAGTNQGGLDTGSKANSTWYHVYLIGTTGGTVDVLFSTSGTSPTMPGGYSYKAHIGWVYSDASGIIRPFLHEGRNWYWSAIVVDLTTTSPTNTTLQEMSVPPGERVEWFGTIFVTNTSPNIRGSVGPGDGSSGNTCAAYSQVASVAHTTHARTLTNTARQVRYDVGNTAGWTGSGFALGTAGWTRLS